MQTLVRSTINFSVDSALLNELGQRLVGRPYIALAELVKNSYDADAIRATIQLDPGKSISVLDNGHGMNFEEFRDFWMRIGSIHKQRQKYSRHFKRPLTGSKGVGRLAVQYLAAKLDLCTTSEYNPNERLCAHVEWEKAVKAGDLTQASMEYEIQTSSTKFDIGTKIVLSNLKHEWNINMVENLSRELWWLQPPFRNPQDVMDQKKRFEIAFISPKKAYEEIFNKGMHAIMDIWYAKLIGKNDKGEVTLSLQFVGEDPLIEKYITPNKILENGDFEIRIYLLEYRQPQGIRVNEAREYFNEYGGVHMYDSGFHLPYYGDQKNDWLSIELDHSHRLSRSKLLPSDWNIDRGLQFLPTLSRIFGVVNVNTSEEKDLDITITRDRLQFSDAFEDLTFMVRWALDFYALQEKLRSLKRESVIGQTEPLQIRNIKEVLANYEHQIPKETFNVMRKDIEKVVAHIQTDYDAVNKKLNVIGPLATAGISSVAYQHELRRQFSEIDDLLKRLSKIKVANLASKSILEEVKSTLLSWVERARMTNAIFSYVGNPENLQIRERFLARKVINEVKDQVRFLMRGVPIEIDKIDDSLLLPKASLAEWSAIFQNVFVNAFNTMLDSERKLIAVSSRTQNKQVEILVQNTGLEIDLKEADSLFEPFVRRINVSPERQALGYGGMGLGLTIVRMIANNIGCDVSFKEPEKGFNTAFSLRWREK